MKLDKQTTIKNMFEVGAHYAYKRSRRHPSVAPYIYGAKNKIEIIDLEKTEMLFDDAKVFVHSLAKRGKKVLFVASKHEALIAIKDGATSIAQPYVVGRWIGGTLTNYTEIRKRVERLHELTTQRDNGELEKKYKKKEILLLMREMAKLENHFGGITTMKEMPGAVFVVDSKKEHTAVREAHNLDIPLISLDGSDCDIKLVDYPIVANDSSRSSIEFFVSEIVNAYKEGALEYVSPKTTDKTVKKGL